MMISCGNLWLHSSTLANILCISFEIEMILIQISSTPYVLCKNKRFSQALNARSRIGLRRPVFQNDEQDLWIDAKLVPFVIIRDIDFSV